MSNFQNIYKISENEIMFYFPVVSLSGSGNPILQQFNFDNPAVERLQFDKVYEIKKFEIYTDFTAEITVRKAITDGVFTTTFDKKIIISLNDIKNVNQTTFSNVNEYPEQFLLKQDYIKIEQNLFKSLVKKINTYMALYFQENISNALATTSYVITYTITGVDLLEYQHRVKLTI
jgi:hypothetical protein